jgi:hypothetical protein
MIALSNKKLGLYMKLILTIVLFASSLFVSAAGMGDEPTLSGTRQTELIQRLGEILREKDITRKQYEESVAWVKSSPCNGIDRRLGAARKSRLENAVAKEQNRKAVKVFESLSSNGWVILYTDASDGDEPYMFYSSDPLKGGHLVTIWSGAAAIFETSGIRKWVKDNAPGIPDKIASCFAWHVTLDRK